MKCLVTGAGGFVGSAVCRALAAAGHDVTGLVRRAGPAPVAGDVRVLVQDLTALSVGAFSLRGYDVVVHAAGIAHQRAPAARHVAVNEAATVALARCAARDGVGKFIFLSSVKAMGPSAGTTPRRESQLAEPRGAYGASKRRAEIALASLAAESGLPVISLRPTLVYGAGVRGNLATLVSWVRRGLPLLPEAGARSMVSRGDLARLLVMLIAQDPAQVPSGGVIWNVADGQAYSTRRLMLALASAMQRPAPRVVLPASCWRFLGACADLRRGDAPGTTASALLESELYDAGALRAATAWRPRECFEDVAPAIVQAMAAS